MINSKVLFLTFTDQYNWGFSGKYQINLNCPGDIDDNWYSSLCQVFPQVLRYDLYKNANSGGIAHVNREITALFDIYRPDYVIYPCNFSGIVTVETLMYFRKNGCFVIGFFFDDEVYFDKYSKWMVPYLDYCITNEPARLKEYQTLGVRAFAAVPVTVLSPSIFCRTNNQEKKYDVSFFGSLNRSRREYFSDIVKHGVPVSHFGGFGEKIHYSRITNIINQSCINLNFTANDNFSERKVKQIKARIFEITLCGGFLLTEYAPHLEDYFKIDYEIACFKTASEASEKIRYYLKNVKEREEVALRGYNRAASSYAGPIILNKVFSAIQKDLLENGRPKIVNSDNTRNSLMRDDAQQYYMWTKALLKQPFLLRMEWLETAHMVLRTDPEHKDIKKLLKYYKRFKWIGVWFWRLEVYFYELMIRLRKLLNGL